MRFLALAFLTATPVLADPACVAAPTQDCVFSMAVDQALERPKVEDVLQGLVETALWQEAAGRDDWAATLERLPPILRAEPEFDVFDLGGTLLVLAISNASGDGPYLVPTTRTAAHLGHVLSEFAPDPDRVDAPDLFHLGLASDLSAIAGFIRAADPAKSEALAEAAAAGLINAGRIEDAFSLLGLVPSAALSGKISRLATQHVLTTSGPAAAQALAQRFANKGDRIDALFAVAHRWATTGHPDKALAIARKLPPEVWLSEDRSDAWLLAEIVASGGVASLLVQGTYPDRPAILGPHRSLQQVQVIAAALNGDVPAALLAVDGYPASVRRGSVNAALQSRWIVDGQAGAEEILALLPTEDLPGALAALGLAQIGTGDLPAALATEARISALSRQHPALKSLRRGLAPLLAAKGQAVEAAALAEKLGDPWATAHVAAAMERAGAAETP